MVAQKITRLRHTKKVETGAGTPAPASTLSTSGETDRRESHAVTCSSSA
jgi:hypothetical protein